VWTVRSALTSDIPVPKDRNEDEMAGEIPAECSARMMETIQRCMKEKIFDRYTLCWVNEHELYFGDMDDDSFSLLCDAASLPHTTSLALYDQVKQSAKSNVRMKKKWIADVRFENQIIVYGDRGEGYGKSI